jgi:hypothetical protein
LLASGGVWIGSMRAKRLVVSTVEHAEAALRAQVGDVDQDVISGS